jgi:hypothetical protein
MTMSDHGHLLLAEVTESLGDFRAESGGPTEEDIRALRAKARSAMDWLEDTPEFADAHRVADELGRLIRQERPEACRVAFEDQTYYQTCPIALSHNRIGLSPAFVIHASECSICRQDPWECPHVLGEEYDGEIAHVVITKAEPIEVSFVSRPRQPDARIVKQSLSSSELAQELGPDFVPGDDVLCGRCLVTCSGVSDTFDRDVAQLSERD